jgi:hypothetical protein
LAWDKVQTELRQGYNYSSLLKKTNTTENKLRRAIIFLATNNLINYKHIPFHLPSSHNPEITSQIQTLIRQGTPIKKIPKLLKLKHIHFLFYWLSAEIRKTYLSETPKKPNKYGMYASGNSTSSRMTA